MITYEMIDREFKRFAGTVRFDISESIADSMRRAMTLIVNKGRSGAKYNSNLLLWGEDLDRVKCIGRGIASILYRMAAGSENALSIHRITEECFLDSEHYAEQYMKDNVLLIEEFKGVDLDKLYKCLEMLRDADWKTSVIICVSPEDMAKLQEYKADDFRLSNYMLGNKFHIPADTEEDVLQQTVNALSRDYEISDEFKTKLKLYIDAVYPEAVYIGDKFVEDLIERIMKEHYAGVLNPERTLTEADVPYSKKAEEIALAMAEEAADAPETEAGAEAAFDGSEIEILSKEPVDAPERPELTRYFAEPYVYEKVEPEKDHTNIMLAALSKMASKYNETEFELNDGSIVTGLYQLDPVPKAIYKQLAEQNDALDKVILLCSEASLRQGTLTVDGKELGQTTAIDLFYNNIKGYMNPEIEKPEQRFIVVRLDENDPSKGISDAVRIIMNEKNPRLFIDPHGGLRNAQFSLLAIASLIENTKIAEIVRTYDVRFAENKDSDEKNKINVSNEAIKIHSFVSGMNEFLNYGRINSLEKYLETEDELTKAIKKVSEGITMCMIPVFDEGIKMLKAYFNKKSSGNKENVYMQLFRDVIREDYGDLIRTTSQINKVKWCRDKGMYQQAVTLITENMYQDIYGDGLITVSEAFKERMRKEIADRNCEREISRNEDRAILNGIVFMYDNLKPYEFNGKILKSKDSLYSSKALPASKQHVSFEKGCDIDYKYGVAIADNTGGKIHVLLTLHKQMKDIRNKLNHAAQKNPYKYPAIIKAVDMYIDLYETLLSDNSSSEDMDDAIERLMNKYKK